MKKFSFLLILFFLALEALPLPPADNMKATMRRLDEKHYEISFSIKRFPLIGLDIKEGERIGLNIEILAEKDSPRWLCLFQPQQLIPLVIE